MSQGGALNGSGNGGASIETITGDAGGPVGPDGANNINLLSDANITITGNPGTNSLTVSLDSTIDVEFTADSGTAQPAAGNLNVLGTDNQVTTTAAGSTVTWSTPTEFIAPGSIESITSTTVGQNLDVTGGITVDVSTVINTANSGYVLGPNDSYFVQVDCTGGPVDVLLPAVPVVGQTWVIAQVTNAVNTMTVRGNGNNMISSAYGVVAQAATASRTGLLLFWTGSIWWFQYLQ